MPNRSIITAVGSYRTRAAARSDFGALGATGEHSRGAIAGALLEKGSDGRLTVDAYECSPNGPVWGGLLVASALTVLAPPIGLALLTRLVGGMVVIAGASTF